MNYEQLKQAASELLDALKNEHNSGRPVPRSIVVRMKIRALRELLNRPPDPNECDATESQ